VGKILASPAGGRNLVPANGARVAVWASADCLILGLDCALITKQSVAV